MMGDELVEDQKAKRGDEDQKTRGREEADDKPAGQPVG
jgi:hypothetical protein